MADIFVSRSHGTTYNYGAIGLISGIVISDSSGQSLSYVDIYDDGNEEAKKDLSNCELMLFAGCKTADSEKSICYAAVLAGAKCSVGFEASIQCEDANIFTKFFFDFYMDNTSSSIDYICNQAVQAGRPDPSNVGSYYRYDIISTISTWKVFD